MKKQEYIDIGISYGLSHNQIERVLLDVLGTTKEQFFLMREISSKYIYEVQQLFYNLANGDTPEEYTLGHTEFYGRKFQVDSRVLIPRNDTEVLVSFALEKINSGIDTRNMYYIDVGTGSANIPVSIVLEMYPLKFEKNKAVDISPDALEIAQKNMDEYTGKKIELHCSDLLECIYHDNSLEKKDLFITANLPYIKDGDSENMDEGVVKHEPDTALYGGRETGFELYEKLIKQCFQVQQIHKIGDIHLFIEIGFDQYLHTKKFLGDLGLSFEYKKDSSGKERVIYITGF